MEGEANNKADAIASTGELRSAPPPEHKKFVRVVVDGTRGLLAEFLPARDMDLPRLLLDEHALAAEVALGAPWDQLGSQERIALRAIDALWKRLAAAGDKRAKAVVADRQAAREAARAERGQ